MKKLLFLSVMMLACAQVFSQVPSKREFRGVWVSTVTNIDWPAMPSNAVEKQKSDLIALFDKLAAAGCNAVIFQVRPECDALYDSPYEPWSYWLTGGQGVAPVPYYDPLQFAVEEAHKRGMELHAWFNPYRAVKTIGYYPLSPKHVAVKHPEWLLTSVSENMRYLNPGLQDVRNYVAMICADIVRRYDVDGLHADDYFYPYTPIQNEDAATFAAYPRGFTNLYDWRRDNVNLLMKQIMDSVNAVNPNVKFGMSPFGIWKSGIPSGTSGLDAYSVLYGDAVAWLQNKWIDYVTPQLYWKTGGSQDYAKLMPWWASQANGRHFYPGLGVFNIGKSTYGNAGMPASQIRLNRSTGLAQGVIMFTANNIRDNLGGLTDTLAKDLYLYKAIPPVCNWKDTIKPNAPQNVRYAKVPGKAIAQLMWDVPAKAVDGDTANRYVIYRFAHGSVAPSEIDDPRNITQITSLRAISPAAPSQNQTTYFVVTSLDKNNNESVMSGIASVAPPDAPLLAVPAAGVTNQPQGLTVSWKSSESASMYQLQVSSDSTFATGLVINDATITDTVKSVTVLSGQQTYYWRVRGLNAAGTGAFSETRSFVTGFPSTPLLALPTNYFTTAPTTGTLAWMKNPSADSYRVQLSTASDFSTTVIDTAAVKDTVIAYVNLASLRIHFWRVTASNATGVSNWSDVWRFKTTTPAAVAEHSASVPSEFALGQNYPNPFNPSTTIQFAVSKACRVQIALYDVLGRRVAMLVDEAMQPGTYVMPWNASALPSGIYFYRMTAGGFSDVKRMLLQK